MIDKENLLIDARLVLRVTCTDFDNEIRGLVDAAIQDLGVAGVEIPEEESAIVIHAILTYVKCNFGSPEEYDRLKASYDEQKAQLSTCTGFTNWGA